MDPPGTIQLCRAYKLMFINESTRLTKISKGLKITSTLLAGFSATAVFSDAATSGGTVMQYIVGSCSFLGGLMATIPEILKINEHINKYSIGFTMAGDIIRKLQDIDEETGMSSDILDAIADLETQAFEMPERCYHAVGSYLEKVGMKGLI